MAHGFEIRGVNVARGINAPVGKFGRLFPTLEPRRPTGLSEAVALGAPGGLMDGGATTPDQDNPEIPAGFTGGFNRS
ncbi:MAG: hypothetical protein ACRDR6_27565 [Pseudonocardiaceae bacterium]